MCLGLGLAVVRDPAPPLDNRLARTPPMGWNSWNHFGCDVSAQLIRETADAMIKGGMRDARSEEHTSELQSQSNLVCRLLLEKKKTTNDAVSRRQDVLVPAVRMSPQAFAQSTASWLQSLFVAPVGCRFHRLRLRRRPE